MADETKPASRPTLTFVSRCGGSSGIRSRLLRLVRSSHPCAIVVLAVLAPGCIFPEPPTWEGPKKTQPLLSNPVPSIEEFKSLSFGGTLNFSVLETSEDAGEALRAIWYRDKEYVNNRDIPPGHPNVQKTIGASWPVTTKEMECVPFRLVVMHVSNDGNNNSDSGILDHSPVNLDDASTMTWWLNLNNSPSCPGGGTP
jgi:hypothetical protein